MPVRVPGSVTPHHVQPPRGEGQQADPPYIAGLASATGNPGWWTDQYGNPRVVVGDAAWGLLPNAGRWTSGNWQGTLDSYVKTRAAQGFTVIYTDALGSVHNGAAANAQSWDGLAMFSSTSPVTLNDAYWQRLDALLALARSYGMTVLLNLGGSWDWNDAGLALTGFTNTQAQQYGAAMASRYLGTRNLLWQVQDDYFGDVDAKLDAMLTGIRSTGDTRPISVQNMPESTSRKPLDTGTAAWGTAHAAWNWVYSYQCTYFGVEEAYKESSPLPVLYGDGYFYQGGPSYSTSPPYDRAIRQDALWAIASGSRGFVQGDEAIWQWQATAQAAAATQWWHANGAGKVRAFLESIPNWHLLMPDTSNALVTGGRGTRVSSLTSGGGGGQYEPAVTNDYVAASRNPDGSAALLYVPTAKTVTIDTSKMGFGFSAWKVDPVTLAQTAVTAGATYNTSGFGSNSQGEPDWLILLLGPALTLVKAGTGLSPGMGSGTMPLHQAGTGTARGAGMAAVQVNRAAVSGTVTFGSVAPSANGFGASATPYQWTHTVAADDTLLIVGLSCGTDGRTLTVTANGTTMTTTAGSNLWKRHTNDGTAGFGQLYVLPAPPSGTVTIAVSGATSGDRIAGGSYTFKGTALTSAAYGTPVSAAGFTATATVNLTTASSSNMAAAIAAAGNGFAAVGGTSTSRWSSNPTDTNSGAGNSEGQTAPATGSSVTMSRALTSDFWAIFAIEVIAAVGAGAFIEFKKGLYASSAGVGSGVKVVTGSGTTFTKDGTGLAPGTGTGSRVLAHQKAGTGLAPGIGTGVQETDRVKAGPGMTSGIGTGSKSATHPKSGTGLAPGIGNGARQVITLVKSGMAASAGIGTGTRVITHQKNGAALTAGIGSGIRNLVSQRTGAGLAPGMGIGSRSITSLVKSGPGMAPGIGYGVKSLTSPGSVVETGTGLAPGVGSGVKLLTRQRAGAGLAPGVGIALRTRTWVKAGPGLSSGMGSGADSRVLPRSGAGLTPGVGSGARPRVVILLAGLGVSAPHGRWSAGKPHGRYAAGNPHGRWAAGPPHS